MLVGLVLFLAPLPAVFTAVPVTVFDRRWTVSLVTWPNSYSGSFILPAEKPCTMSVEWACLCSSLGSTQQRLRRGCALLPKVGIPPHTFSQWDQSRWGSCSISVLQNPCWHIPRNALPGALSITYGLLGKAIPSPHAPVPLLDTLPALRKGQHILSPFSFHDTIQAYNRRCCTFSPSFSFSARTTSFIWKISHLRLSFYTEVGVFLPVLWMIPVNAVFTGTLSVKICIWGWNAL